MDPEATLRQIRAHLETAKAYRDDGNEERGEIGELVEAVDLLLALARRYCGELRNSATNQRAFHELDKLRELLP
jgi:hypothetical protein